MIHVSKNIFIAHKAYEDAFIYAKVTCTNFLEKYIAQLNSRYKERETND
jgi:hypothetical protein